MTKQEIIEETVEYYKNNPFGYNSAGSKCVYYGSNEQMCAVGRCMINPKLYGDKDLSAFTLLEENSDNILKEEYRGHSSDFWNHLQAFHDDCARKYFNLENYQNFWSLKKYYDRQEA